MAFSIRRYIYAMRSETNTASEELVSTVSVLPDQVLLEQTRMLARHEQALQLSVLDHLREIEARRLYLRLGYSSLFDYTVRELHYTEASAWRRIKAMRLCRETSGVRAWLQDGSLNLSNAALLQNSFERWDRSGGAPVATGSSGARTNAAPRAGSAPEAAPGKAAGEPLPVLDARGRQQMVERAVGKSTRQVQQMLAEVDPEAAAPAERLRALGNGRWEMRAVIDTECQRGLQQLRELLSHVDPHLTVGQLVGRLVREGLERYDPSRPPRRKRRESTPAGDERSSGTAGGRWPIAWRLLRRTRVDPGSPRRRRCPLPQRGAPRSRRQTALRRPTCRQVVAPGEPWPGDRSGRRRAAALRRRSALRRVQIAAGAPAARWRGGAVARWRGGAVARWRGGAVARWRGGAVARWRGGAVARWRGGAVARWRRSLLRRRSRAWQPAVRFRIGARGAQDRRSRLRRRSPAWQPAVRYRSGGPAAQGSRLRWRSPADRRADRFRLR